MSLGGGRVVEINNNTQTIITMFLCELLDENYNNDLFR
jgi:hypothetical protein